MSPSVNVRNAPPVAIAVLQGGLDGASQVTLKQQLQPLLANGQISTIRRDVAAVQSIEPSRSGMPMMLGHTAKAKNKTVAVANANPTALATMLKANLGKVLKLV